MSRNNEEEKKEDNEILSVSKYLSLYPRDYLINELVKAEFKLAAMTKNEWDKAIEELLSRKTIY